MKKILLCIFILFIRYNLISEENFFATKPFSMGNAYTAVSGDIFSLYYNPAGIASSQNIFFNLDIGGGYNFSGGILYNINEIISISEKFSKLSQIQTYGGSIDITQLTALFYAIKNLNDISLPGKGIIAKLNGGVGIKIRNYGFSVRNYTVLGLKPTLDTGFYLGNMTLNTINFVKSINFPTEIGGVYISNISTGPVTDPDLVEIQSKLKDVVDTFLDTKLLKDFGISIPSDISSDQIANALINVALENGISAQEIKDAVKKLTDKDFQDKIKKFIEDYLSDLKKQFFSDNKSGLLVQGLNITELSLTYARELFFPNLYIGTNLKYLLGSTIYYNYLIFKETKKLDFSNMAELKDRITKKSNAVSVDLGAIYQLPIKIKPIKTKLGIVVNNLVEPEFELADSENKLNLPRKLKTGFSAEMFKLLTFSADFDITKTKTLIPGYYNQNLCFGLEVNPTTFFVLRAGFIKNIAMIRDETITAGLGLKLFGLNIDLATAASSTNVYLDETVLVPSSAFVSLGVNFGF